jgi:hypothetical protein
VGERRICIFFREPLPTDRWHKGDHVWRAGLRRLIRGPEAVGGIKSVYVNLLKGLDKINAPYVTNIPYDQIRDSDLVGVMGLGTKCLDGYVRENRILAGVALVEHPQNWPTLFDDYPVASNIVHCDWVKAMFERHYGPRISKWAVGIDTDRWTPGPATTKTVDVLIYDKVRWDHDRVHRAIVDPIIDTLKKRGMNFERIRYGFYKHNQFRAALSRAKTMLFLCEHETQGLAYQEAMSCNLPILAWDPGAWLDPWRYRYGEGHVPATSVPFFDERCGATFLGAPDFEGVLDLFLDRARSEKFKPRDYVLENLTLEGCARNYVDLLNKFAG